MGTESQGQTLSRDRDVIAQDVLDRRAGRTGPSRVGPTAATGPGRGA